jgi:hypothetical protein
VEIFFVTEIADPSQIGSSSLEHNGPGPAPVENGIGTSGYWKETFLASEELLPKIARREDPTCMFRAGPPKKWTVLAT